MEKIDLASEIEQNLRNGGFRVWRSRKLSNRQVCKLCLGVGPVVVIFESGKVSVRGAVKPKFEWCEDELTRLLPVNVRWTLKL